MAWLLSHTLRSRSAKKTVEFVNFIENEKEKCVKKYIATFLFSDAMAMMIVLEKIKYFVFISAGFKKILFSFD